MKTFLRTFTKLTPLLLAGVVAGAGAASLDDEQWSMLEDYCTECHNLDDFSGGLAFDLMAPDHIHQDAKIWEEVVRKLRGGMMPPPGQPRPEKSRLTSFIGDLEGALDKDAAADPDPGAPLLHRLNRAEYANAVRDLLDLPLDTGNLFPADDSSAGFDNIANALNVSPALMQAYVTTAAKVSRLAVGDLTSSPMITNYRSGPVSQSRNIEGFPLGTRGGVKVQHVFPLDAEYEINIRRTGGGIFTFPSVQTREPIELAVDGQRVQVIPAGKPTSLKLTIPAGPHTIEATFLHTQPEQGVDDMYTEKAGTTAIGGIAITGPLNVTGPGDTPSRRRIFVCRPETATEQEPCARQILGRLATRAYRHPVDGDSMAILLKFYRSGNELRGFETGIQYALARILVDPQFVYRFEKEPENLDVGAVYPVGDYELASRLSFFLWSSIPDDELLSLAGQGRLSDPKVLAGQVDRMLASDKASALVDNFAAQWLSLRALDAINPISPDYDTTLRESMKRETMLLFESILREDRSIIDLLDADYTFVDERLARHYGIPNIRGSRFRRVKIEDEARRGILGQGSILTLTSAPNRTSPVMRGKWVLENILGTPPPNPPEGVNTDLDSAGRFGPVPKTVRQRLEQHRADPTCAGCHGMIDPIGFALENFDSVGKWRDRIGDQAVDASSTLWDGTPVNGPAGLRKAILGKSENFVTTATEKLLTYALGRKVEYYDMPAVREIVGNAAKNDYRFSDLVQGIVASRPFRFRKKEGRMAAQQ